MKTLRLIGIALLTVLLSVSFTACGGDDKDEPSGGGGDNKSLIIGKWKVVGESTWHATNVEYKSDGSFSYTSTEDPKYEEHGSYKIEGNLLYELFSDEEDWDMKKIVVLDKTTLTLSNSSGTKQYYLQRVI